MLQENDVIGSYQILQRIGKGGMGVIYLAYHLNLRKYVVLKQIMIGGRDAESLRRESDILKNLHHTYLPQIYDYVIQSDQVFTVMDFIDGEDLSKLPTGQNLIPEAQLLRWLRQLAEVLVYLERQNPPIVHSDIKPSNIIRRENGDICLIDFNISFTESVLGGMQGLTKEFASPEQIYMHQYLTQGIVPEFTLDVRTDIYSVGATFYYLITGRAAGGDSEAAPLTAYTGLAYSPALLSILDKCLRRDREERYRNARELLKALDNLKKLDARYRRYVALKVTSLLGSAAIMGLGAFLLTHGIQVRVREDYWRDVSALVQAAETGEDAEELGLKILNHEGYRTVMTENPESAATVYRALGDACYRERNFAEAADRYREALTYAEKAGTDATDYYRDLGLALAYANRMGEAKTVLEEARQHNAGSIALAQITLAIAASEGNEGVCLEAAEEILSGTTEEEVLRQTCFAMAELYEGKGDLDQALGWLDRSETYGQDRETLARRGTLYLEKMRQSQGTNERRKNAQAAAEVYRRLCQQSDALVTDRINFAIALRALESYGEACGELEKVLETDPDNCAATMYLAVINRERGYSNQARDFALKAVALYEQLPPERQQAIDRNLVSAVREIAAG